MEWGYQAFYMSTSAIKNKKQQAYSLKAKVKNGN